ncbi:MAG TPA: DNA oxidative demethylase AlkB [Steroidobacteraceae bacterium]|nr:DNA oxidative demethylase AlkB [Steroidobacteraceae bacterium]
MNEQAQLLPRASVEPLGEAAALLPGFARAQADTLPPLLQTLWRAAPLRHMSTPGGARMSVAMSNCGPFGWVSDRRGYRYEHCDPHSGQPWPPMPPQLRELAQRAAAALRFVDFEPDACLINYYAPGTRLTLHQDRDERDLGAPVVSVSCGLPATFLFGGLRRRDAVRRVPLFHGDVVVWGGAQRLAFHGVAPLADGQHPIAGRCRVNLTFRRAR